MGRFLFKMSLIKWKQIVKCLSNSLSTFSDLIGIHCIRKVIDRHSFSVSGGVAGAAPVPSRDQREFGKEY